VGGKAQNHENILSGAAPSFREHGVIAVSKTLEEGDHDQVTN